MPAFSRAFVDKTDASVHRDVSSQEPLCVRRRASTHTARQSLPSLTVGCRSRKQTYPASPNYATQPPLVVSRVPSAERRKQRHAKREIRAVGRSASTHTASPSLPALTVGLRVAFRYISLRATAVDSKKLRRTSVRTFTTISPAPYAQPPLAVSINVPCEKRCITGKMGVLIGESTPNAHPVPQSSCQK